MGTLTVKELQALSDQLGFEKALHCKYLDSSQACTDKALKPKYNALAKQHKANYTCLLGFLEN